MEREGTALLSSSVVAVLGCGTGSVAAASVALLGPGCSALADAGAGAVDGEGSVDPEQLTDSRTRKVTLRSFMLARYSKAPLAGRALAGG